MVLLVIRQSAGDHDWCFQASRSMSMDTVSTDVARIHNLQLRIVRLANAMKQLAADGVHRPGNLVGLTLEQIHELGQGSLLGPKEDIMGRRLGNPPDKKLADVLCKTADDALKTFDKSKGAGRICLDEKEMLESIETCRGAVMMAYPMGLPEYEPARAAYENKEDVSQEKGVMDENTSVLWFANKIMAREQPLGKFISMENATIKVRLQARGQSAPQREVDTAARNAMYQQYHKRKETEKRLAAADDDEYLNSAWANPKAYKNQMHGLGNIRWR